MANTRLWDQLKEWKSSEYKWVDLTHELSPETPHWYGFKPLEGEKLFDYVEKENPEETWCEAPMQVYLYTFPGQYGTHVDVPLHFVNGRSMEQISVEEFAYPLCVIDKSEAVKANPDYALTVQDILDWEKTYGMIPEGAFVAFRSDWYKRPAEIFDNYDENQIPHYPGWEVEAIQFLVDQRKIGAIGHEPADTDPGIVTAKPDCYPYPGEKYILEQDRFQIELMANLDQVPPTGSVIFCTFPKLKGGTGFSARCFAICPRE